uniref:CST complex subunit CTC1 n=1 Tax=Malurus cyaneus samueli TaxID=2593467 RepID=A0A8C5X3U1_9PASS
DLQHQQRIPCCSHLSWSTNEFKEWSHQGQGALPMQSTLPRTYLILVGYLTDGRQENEEKLVDGCLYVKDKTGIIPCELLHFELEWLESLFVFPSWSYIPQTDQSAAGYLEILVDPVPVNGPKEMLHSIPITSPVSAEPLLSSSIKPSQLVWHHVFQLGHRYTITGLSMSSLKKSGQRMFITSVSSCLLPYCAEQVREQPLNSAWQGESTQSSSLETAEHLSGSLELGAEEERSRSTKESRIISYVGFVTKILNVQAGLFLLDNQICLCLAYRPLLNSARGFRPGTCVELTDVHLLQKPLVSFPFTVLAACLSSTVVLKSFSRLSTPYQPLNSSGNLCLQLLFRFNLGMPLYLWLVSLLEMLCPNVLCRVPSRTRDHLIPFLVPLLQAMVPDREEARDIYNEILAKTHQCPLQKYLPLNPPCQVPSLAVVCRVAEQKSWEGFSPSQLLSPSEAQHMGTQELNRRLAWSYCTLSAESFQPQLILLGVLRVSSRSSALQLQDKSSTLPCVISHKDGSPFAQTSLIDCGSLLRSNRLVFASFCFREPMHLANCAAVSGNRGKMPECCILLHVKRARKMGMEMEMGMGMLYLENLGGGTFVKLSVSAAPGSLVVMDIYITASYLQHLWGLLPGAKVLFQNLERKISRVLVEDGTGEAVVLCRNEHVAAVLGLSPLEWEAVQNCVQSRGSVYIQHGEAPGTGCLEEPEDLVASYLRSLCRSPLICRPILLDFSLDRKPSKILQPGEQALLAFLKISVGRKEASQQAGEGELPSLPTKQEFRRISLESGIL